MLSYTHFTLEERKYLQQLLDEGYSIRKIASALSRNPSSVSREIKRNKAKYPTAKNKSNRYLYHHWRANTAAICRRRINARRAIPEGSECEAFILQHLGLFWSPEQIVAIWRRMNPMSSLSFSSIYRYIHRGWLEHIRSQTHLRRRGKNRRMVRHNSYTIHPDRIIPDWPDEIVSRSRIGDWEGDTVYGGIGKGLLVTLVDRKTRYLCAGLIRSRDAGLTGDMILHLLHSLPVKSLSLDNGSEFAEFRRIEQGLNAPVYFAEPHKPWQRGTNENTNDILRFFFPKGFNFHLITDDDVAAVVDLINHRPRKCLGWLSPAELMECVALT